MSSSCLQSSWIDPGTGGGGGGGGGGGIDDGWGVDIRTGRNQGQIELGNYAGYNGIGEDQSDPNSDFKGLELLEHAQGGGMNQGVDGTGAPDPTKVYFDWGSQNDESVPGYYLLVKAGQGQMNSAFSSYPDDVKALFPPALNPAPTTPGLYKVVGDQLQASLTPGRLYCIAMVSKTPTIEWMVV